MLARTTSFLVRYGYDAAMTHHLPHTPDELVDAPPPARHEMLARIETAQRLQFFPAPPRVSADFARVRNLQIGAAVAIVLFVALMLPFGERMMRFAAVAGGVFLVLGVLSARMSKILRERIARKRVERLGQVDLVGATLIAPSRQGALQFDLDAPHTLLRSWTRLTGTTGVQTLSTLLIAQDGRRTLLFSDEPCDSATARDYGFTIEDGDESFAHIPHEERVRVPLRGLQELSRLIDKNA